MTPITLIIIYCICDDVLKALRHQDDPQVKLTTAEILTIGIASALYHGCNLSQTRICLHSHHYFNNMISISKLIRKLHSIPHETWQIILHTLSASLNGEKPTLEFIIDSFPMPVCQPYKSKVCKLYRGKEYLGFCSSKKLHYYGIKVHMIISEYGIPIEFCFTPASFHDLEGMKNLSINLPQGSTLYADKAYTSYQLEDMLLDFENIHLIAQRKRNSKRTHSKETSYIYSKKRSRIETVFSCINKLLPRAIYARTSRGFELKILLFILASVFTYFV